MLEDPDERITIDPEQCGGRPCIRGMRIRVTEMSVPDAIRHFES